MQKTNEPSLKRQIGPISLALNAVNLTVGSGIFVLPAIVAAELGPASFIAYFTCGILVILNYALLCRNWQQDYQRRRLVCLCRKSIWPFGWFF
ncbi:MAG: hypothetical protein WDM90_19960 [Ferruginibacter sp.]